MKDPFSRSDFDLSTYNLSDNSDAQPQDEETNDSDQSSAEEEQEDQSPQTDMKIDIEQLPDELQNSMETHIELFSESGVEVIGLGQIDIDDDSDFKDPEEHDDIGLELEYINLIEMFCEVGDSRFVYTFLPNKSYNGIEVQYNVLQELFLVSEVDALDDMDDMQRIQAINMLEDILSQKDLGSVLRANRTVERSDLVSWVNILRSQNSDFIHVLDYTPEGEVVGSHIEKRVYLPEDEIDKEKRLHKAVQKIVNISRSYSGVLAVSYLDNGVRIPDSIAEKVRASVEQEDWGSYDAEDNNTQSSRGFQ